MAGFPRPGKLFATGINNPELNSGFENRFVHDHIGNHEPGVHQLQMQFFEFG
jgi:hypothetical protein